MMLRTCLVAAFLIGAHFNACASDLIVLNYHDVVANPGNDRFAVSRATFVAHMDYLQQNGYQPLALAALEQAIEKHTALPDKAVVLTFDDGLKSYREFVSPLLEIYQFPSVVSLVTAWLDGIDVPPEYRGKIMSWNDARQLSASRWVSVVSHTHNLHQGILANSRGNQRGAGITRQYFPVKQGFEDEVQFRERIRRDLALSALRMQQELSRAPHAVAWPYGEYDEVVLAEARALGMTVHFVLSDSDNSDIAKGVVGRTLVVDRPDVDNFAKLLSRSTTPVPRHFAELSLDAYVGKTEAEQETLLSDTLERLAALHVNSVIISPVSADGRHAFFTTAACATATDILDRVVHQIRTRLNIRYVVLRIPARMQFGDERTFFTDLSRLIRFNALLFAAEQDAKKTKMVREVVARYRPHVNYGLFGDGPRSADFDFFLISLAAIRDVVSLDPARVWVTISDARDEHAFQGVVAQLAAQRLLNYEIPLQVLVDNGKPLDGIKSDTRSGS